MQAGGAMADRPAPAGGQTAIDPTGLAAIRYRGRKMGNATSVPMAHTHPSPGPPAKRARASCATQAAAAADTAMKMARPGGNACSGGRDTDMAAWISS